MIWLGGNHLSVLPVYEELGSRNASVLQFDAHIDIYNLDANKKELNHGNWVRHIEKLPEIVNIGHRDLFLTPKSIHEFFESAYSATDLARDPAGIDAFMAAAGDVSDYDGIGDVAFGEPRALWALKGNVMVNVSFWFVELPEVEGVVPIDPILALTRDAVNRLP